MYKIVHGLPSGWAAMLGTCTDDTLQVTLMHNHPHPASLQIRLVEEDTSYCTYGEAYEVNCARYGRQPDQPIVQFKKRICDERGQLIIDPKGELRQQVLHCHCPWHVCS